MLIHQLRALTLSFTAGFMLSACSSSTEEGLPGAEAATVNSSSQVSSSSQLSATSEVSSFAQVSSTPAVTPQVPSTPPASSASSASPNSSLSSASLGSSSSAAVAQKTAIETVHAFCTSCHFDTHITWADYTTDQGWLNAQDEKGQSYIDELDPENSLLLKRMSYYGASNSNMPMDNANQNEAFTLADYERVRDWVVSISGGASESVGDGSVKVTQLMFDEQGLTLGLDCTADSTEVLDLVISDPEKFNNVMLSDYSGVKVRQDGVTPVDVDALTMMGEQDSFWLTGEGLDIWETNVFFNGLSSSISNEQGVDFTLDVHEVIGLTHEFAKVGLLVSSTDDLSGDLVFVHWAGNHGIAEDSGPGQLNDYRQILKNNNTAQATPLPVRLKVVYDNQTLKVGGCFNCKDPALGLAKQFNFKPKRIYVVASSHSGTPLEARVSLVDGYAQQGDLRTVYNGTIDCQSGMARLNVPVANLDGLERLVLEVKRGDTAVAASSAIKSYTAAASCSVQQQLLTPKLRRLSELQIQNSMSDIFGEIFDKSIWPSLEDGAKLIGMNSTADKLNINNINFERLLAFSQAMTAQLLVNHPVISVCAAQSNSQCTRDILEDFGLRIWRRPLTSSELEQFDLAVNTLAGNSEKLAFIFNALTLSSNFLFRSEIGLLNTHNEYELTNYEMVSVLSYAVLNSTPDDELLALAAQPRPLTQNELTSQMLRLFESPKLSAAVMDVYKDYLKLDLVLSRPKDAAFDFNSVVRNDILASAERMIIDNIEKDIPFTQVFAGNEYYVTRDTARLFGVSYSGEQLGKVSISESERFGVLNHPAFLSVHSTLAKSGIVKRGVFTLEQLLCQELPDPPGDVMPVAVPAGIDAEKTSERELLQLTHSAQAACVGCHQVIDPAGFGFENFDSIGRFRTVEKGDVLIDASGVMDNIGDHVLSYTTSAEFSQALIDSPQLKACVSTRFLESFLGQELRPDDCEAAKYGQLATQGQGTVKDLLLSLVQLESFSRRALK